MSNSRPSQNDRKSQIANPSPVRSSVTTTITKIIPQKQMARTKQKSSTAVIAAKCQNSSCFPRSLFRPPKNTDQQTIDYLLSKQSEELKAKYLSNYSAPKASVQEFEFNGILGCGAYAQVVKVKYLGEQKVQTTEMALKIQPKANIIQAKVVNQILSEKKVLSCTNFSFIPKLFFAFKDFANLFLALELSCGGDFFDFLQANKSLPESCVKIFASQIVLVFEYLHGADIIYRDLKPENILLDSNGFLKLTDYGFAKYVPGRTYTLCGTPEYFAPEILQGKAYGKAVDWWCLGIIIYEMIFLKTPFVDFTEDRIYRKIQSETVSFAPNIKCSPNVKDLIINLLQKDCTKRLGFSTHHNVKAHRWFNDISWVAILNKQIDLPGIMKSSTEGSRQLTDFNVANILTAPQELYAKEFENF